jgi:hypothetical protein
MTFAQLRLYGEAERPQSFEEAVEIAKRQRRAMEATGGNGAG